MDFGRQVEVEKRAKSDQKSTKKRIEKMIEKMSVLEAPGGGMPCAGHGAGWILGPPFTLKSKEQRTENREQRTENREHLVTPCAQSAVADRKLPV